MPLKNLRHEDFCQSYALVPNGVRAAHQADYARRTARFQASRLLRRPDIAARIAEIRAENARRTSLDLETLLGKLEAVYQMGLAVGRFAQSIRAVEAQARLAGFLGAPARAAKVNGRDASVDMLTNVDSAAPKRVNGAQAPQAAGSA